MSKPRESNIPMSNDSQSASDQKIFYLPDALGSKRGEGGRVLQSGVSTPSGENRAVWGPPLSGAQEFQPRVAWRVSFRGGATVRMVMVVADPDAAFARAVKAGATVVWPVIFGQSTFGQSTTRNMVGTSDELSIPSDITGKSASLWPTATASLGLLPGS